MNIAGIFIFFLTLYVGWACKGISPDGNFYDLSPLLQQGIISATDKDYKYSIKICENSVPCSSCTTTGYCQESIISNNNYCIGTWDGKVTGQPGGSGVELLYDNGASGRVGRVFIKCDPNGPLVANPVAFSPTEITGYSFNFTSSAACGKKPPTCSGFGLDGSFYDLTPLRNIGTIVQMDQENKWLHSVSICNDSIPCANCLAAGYCQDNRQYKFCVGLWNGQVTGLATGNGVELVYDHAGEGRAGRVIIKCDPNGLLINNKVAITPDQDVTQYQFHFDSSAGCGSKIYV